MPDGAVMEQHDPLGAEPAVMIDEAAQHRGLLPDQRHHREARHRPIPRSPPRPDPCATAPPRLSKRNRAGRAAQMLAEALRRSGGRAALMRGLLGPGRDFLPALLMRVLEVRRLLPARLRSDPAV